MEQYIKKATLVAELEEQRRRYDAAFNNPSFASYEANLIAKGKYRKIQEIISFIDTLEVIEVKGVDLEQEIKKHINDCLDIKFPTTDIKTIAKDVEYTARKFFELGIKLKTK